MTQEDWDALKAQMESPWGSMKLQCDQYELTLEQVTNSKNKSWETVVYVDGYIKGIWWEAEGDQPKYEEARRFMRKVSRALHTKKDLEFYRVTRGKRVATQMAAVKYTRFDHCWKSFTALKKHLLANNTSITRIDEI